MLKDGKNDMKRGAMRVWIGRESVFFCGECLDTNIVLGIEIPLNRNILYDEELSVIVSRCTYASCATPSTGLAVSLP